MAFVFICLSGAASAVRAEVINCVIDRGNLCFPSRCNNTVKNERMIIDLGTNSYRYCPSRYSDDKCISEPMTFSIQETVITGVAPGARETSPRTIFLNRNTGSLTTSLLSLGGIAAIDFGNCELRR